jgi:CheY-like chemotaxis protein
VPSKPSILVVEDSDEDYYTTERTLGKFGSFPLQRCLTAAEILEYLQKQAESGLAETSASLILLDLNLPGKKDGRSVLMELKQDERFRSIPVVIMTTSSNPRDVSYCYKHGASGYLVKPVDLDRFTESIQAMVKYWFETNLLPTTEK